MKLSRQQTMEFSRKNQDAMMMFMKAGEDYLESRCLLLNNLMGGLALASQSIEKLLKTFILLENKKIKWEHDPFKIKESLDTLIMNRYILQHHEGSIRISSSHLEMRYVI